MMEQAPFHGREGIVRRARRPARLDNGVDFVSREDRPGWVIGRIDGDQPRTSADPLCHVAGQLDMAGPALSYYFPCIPRS